MFLTSQILQILPIFLYAETHYRFRYFLSYLWKREPEIIVDAPHRIETNAPLPILFLIKDAHLFPVTISNIIITIQSMDGNDLKIKLLESPITVNNKLWYRIFNIPLDGLSGLIHCDVSFTIVDGKNQHIYHNDNYRTSSHRPLKVFVSSSPLPKYEHLYFGECHAHSSFTDDQVEFGAPLEASIQLSRAIGLSFQCVTNHSYDLDDYLDNYLKLDPELPKWHLLQQEVDNLNFKYQNFITIRGEEVSCRNASNQNVHLLVLGNKNFIFGSGDSAEIWFNTRSENNITNVLSIIESSAIAFAAHPREHISLLQRILLHRGKWHKKDLANKDLSGIQFANGTLKRGFWEGYRIWIDALLKGLHLFVLAGDDAHGNFNRFRQIRIPFFKIHEKNEQLFGKMRTGVFTQSLTEDEILKALRIGQSIITDGPVVNLLLDSQNSYISSLGKNYRTGKYSIKLIANTSFEFGAIDHIEVFKGHIGLSQEFMIISEKPLQCYNINKTYEMEIKDKCYLRAEIWTSSSNSNDGQSHYCITNPLWFSPV